MYILTLVIICCIATKIYEVSATVGTHKGNIQSAWNRFSTIEESDSNTLVFRHAIRIPIGVMATVHVLTFEYAPQKVNITESGRLVWCNGKFLPGQVGVTQGGTGVGDIVFTVMSGSYQFEVIRLQ